MNISKKTLPQLIPIAVLVLFVLFVYALPRLPNTWKLQTQKSQVSTGQNKNKGQTSEIFAKINPPEGYEINATYGDLGPQMIEMGVIDMQKFADTYKSSGQPLTDEQLKILNNGSDKKIRITSENSYFLLNFFWAFGLANQSKVLTDGEMTKYGDGQISGFSSTPALAFF